jgi:hypothetical protein
MTPDSAVAIDSERETQALCSEANGSLLLSGHQSSVV